PPRAGGEGPRGSGGPQGRKRCRALLEPRHGTTTSADVLGRARRPDARAAARGRRGGGRGRGGADEAHADWPARVQADDVWVVPRAGPGRHLPSACVAGLAGRPGRRGGGRQPGRAEAPAGGAAPPRRRAAAAGGGAGRPAELHGPGAPGRLPGGARAPARPAELPGRRGGVGVREQPAGGGPRRRGTSRRQPGLQRRRPFRRRQRAVRGRPAPASWPEWPATIQLHDVLDQRVAKELPPSKSMEPMVPSMGRDFHMKMSLLSQEGLNRRLKSCTPVLDPELKVLIPHKILLLLVMLHDMVVIPYILAWDVPFTGETLDSAEIAVAFWILDICLCFFIGFYKDGELEKRWRVVARNYFTTWFFPDLLAIVCDWASLHELLSEGRGGTRFTLRVPGLLRAHKLVNMYSAVLDKVLSEGKRMAIQSCGVVVFILWVNHIICCTWYSIGRNAPTDTGGRWLDSLDFNSIDHFDATHTLYRYVTAFHWSIGSITAGGVENLFALNSYERSFSILVLVGGLFLFSSLISTFSATLTQLKLIEQEKTQHLRALRQYLSQNNVNEHLSIRVQRQVAERMRRRDRLIEKNVKALSMLSLTMRAELRGDVMGPYLTKHPLIRVCSFVDWRIVQDICGEALDRHLKMPGDNLFVAGGPAATEAFLVISGRLEYFLRASSGLVEADLKEDICAGAWLCEAALWTQWAHVGSADAVEASDVLVISTQALLRELLKNSVIATIVREYGRQFHARLIASSPPCSAWPTDKEIPFTDFGELVLSMTPQVQTLVASITLEGVRRSHPHSFPPGTLDRLEDEVGEQKCAVIMTSGGELERAVTLSALHLERGDGRILVHVGKQLSGELVPVCQLPGAKHGKDGSSNGAVEQLLARLYPLVGSTHFTRVAERTVEYKDSPTFHLRTRYMRAVHFARVETPPETCCLPLPPRDAASAPAMEVFGLQCESPNLTGYDFYTWMHEGDFLSKSQDLGSSEAEIMRILEALDTSAVRAPTLRVSRQTSEEKLGQADGASGGTPRHCAGEGVVVTMVQASGLRGGDVYCKCTVEGPRAQSRAEIGFSFVKTHVVSNSADPEWNSQHVLLGAGPGDVLRLEAWDASAWPQPHDLLGTALLRLAPDRVSDRGVITEELRLDAGGSLTVRVSGLRADAAARVGPLPSLRSQEKLKERGRADPPRPRRPRPPSCRRRNSTAAPPRRTAGPCRSCPARARCPPGGARPRPRGGLAGAPARRA
ncbi:unnamed protein product, partial [Prorocentrum cordatum]